MVVMPYVLFSDQEISRIRNLIDSTVYEWCEATFGASPAVSSLLSQPYQQSENVIDSWFQPKLDVQFITAIGLSSALVNISSDCNEWLTSLGLAPLADHKAHKKPAIHADEAIIVLNAIAKDFLNTIVDLKEQSDTGAELADTELLRRSNIKGGGILFYRVNLHGLLIQVLIDGQQFKVRPNVHDLNSGTRSRKIENRLTACANVSTNLKAFLGKIDLSIGELGKINLGDIIKLDTPVMEPVSLGVASETVICRGSLGASDGRKALRVVS
jgi:flagellar motor switch/type III secretory pathway protein FliN